MKNSKGYENLKELLFIAENQAMEDTEKKNAEFRKHGEETGEWCGMELQELEVAEAKRDTLYEIIDRAGLLDELIDYDYKA